MIPVCPSPSYRGVSLYDSMCIKGKPYETKKLSNKVLYKVAYVLVYATETLLSLWRVL